MIVRSSVVISVGVSTVVRMARQLKRAYTEHSMCADCVRVHVINEPTGAYTII
jgi:hypothetical protein